MSEINHPTGRQLAAARTLTGLGQAELAALANISAPTLRRMEASDGPLTGMANNIAAVVRVLYDHGVIFLDGPYSGDGGPGVRLRSADRA
ncbi:helix-turn-helix domain-containing protein [Sinorhizobium fredii]|uniref:helix-turn-helix domain-containing protein n=1 Tax=Rhizobium fredii TaxID=380 RepID=UPI00056C5395|nr:helix-turn-helix transcriptional regulator [Sinorhizobium fredii]